MNITSVINIPAHKKALKALIALFAFLSFLGGLVVIISGAQLASGFSSIMSMSSSSFLRDPSSILGVFGSLDAFLSFGAMAKIMSILGFAFSCASLLIAYKTKDNMIFNLVGCGASLIQFIMGLILSPVSLRGLISKAVGSGSMGTPVAIPIILIIMAAIVCVANIIGIVAKISDAQLIGKFKQGSQPQQPVMGQPQYQQPMAPQQMQQPVPQAQPQYQQPMAPQQMQQPVPQAQPQYQQPMAPQQMQQPVPQAQPQYQQPVAAQQMQQPVPQAQPQYQQPMAPQQMQQPVSQPQPQYQQPVAAQQMQQPVPQPQQQVQQPQQPNNLNNQ